MRHYEGQAFGRLLVTSPSFRKNGRTLFKCACECGAVGTFNAYVVVHGHTQSCGCFQRARAAETQRGLGAKVSAGDKFGKLETVSPQKVGTRSGWVCKCACGAERLVIQKNLLNGNTTSCGCSRIGKMKPPRRPRSAYLDMPEYGVWKGMNQRCRDKHAQAFRYYGARGIKVCERWSTFENFLADVGPRPTAKHTIERIDNDGPYSPRNCRWATRKEQAANRRPRSR